MEEKKKGRFGCSWKSMGIILGVLFLLSVIANMGKQGKTLPPIEVQSQVAPPVQEEIKKDSWDYSESPDDMGSGTIKWATITSTNFVNFGFPYQGEQKAKLELRTHPRHGHDVILSVEKGQFMSGVYGTTVLVRFDDGPAKKYTANSASDNDPKMLFLQGYNSFVAGAKKSSKIRIEATFYNEGNRVFEFDSAGLKW
jgi:hypothetical protein